MSDPRKALPPVDDVDDSATLVLSRPRDGAEGRVAMHTWVQSFTMMVQQANSSAARAHALRTATVVVLWGCTPCSCRGTPAYLTS